MVNCNSTLHLQDYSKGTEIESLINVLLLMLIELNYYICNDIIMISQVDITKNILSWLISEWIWATDTHFNLCKSRGKYIIAYLASERSGTLKSCTEQNEISRGLLLEGLRIFKAPYGNCDSLCLRFFK